MKENAKKFLRAVSADEALKEELGKAIDIKAILKTAKVHGYDLAAEDFENTDMEEISEDELEAVAGGSFCSCGNSGNGNSHNLNCYCTKAGSGKDPEGGSGFCLCALGLGLGWN